jgi:GTP cyclohydrolase I
MTTVHGDRASLNGSLDRDVVFDRDGSGIAARRHLTRAAPHMKGFDHDLIENGIRMVFEGLGLDPADPRIRDTPGRYARMCDEIFAGLLVDERELLSTVFDEQHEEIVVVRKIPFSSVCEHHLVPFVGQAHIAYLPNADGNVAGLSKIVRLVEVTAKRPSLQERMTNHIADTLTEGLRARGALVVVEAEHMCVAIRGVCKPGSLTVTSAARGSMRADPAARSEALFLLRGLNEHAG